MEFEEWKETLTFKYDQTALNLAEHAFQAGNFARKEQDEEIAENLADEFQAADSNTQSDLKLDREDGAREVEAAIREAE